MVQYFTFFCSWVADIRKVSGRNIEKRAGSLRQSNARQRQKQKLYNNVISQNTYLLPTVKCHIIGHCDRRWAVAWALDSAPIMVD